MKNSNRILLILILAVLSGTTAFTFYARSFLQEPLTGTTMIPPGPDGAIWMRDTFSASYHYIWTDFPEVQLNPKAANFVEKITFGDAVDRVAVEVRNDTLYIRQVPSNDYENYDYLLVDIREHDTQIIVGAGHKLKGLTAVNRGRITHFETDKAPAIGEGREVPIPNMFKVPFECDDLEVNLESGGDAVIVVKASTIKVNLSEPSLFHTHSRLRLSGECRSLKLHHSGSRVDVKTQHLNTDTLFLKTETPFSQRSTLMRVRANQYLNAQIKGWSDVMYLGQPTIKKEEGLVSRLIDGNYYP